MRVALRLAYDGASFTGWQTQPAGTGVQDRVEAALAGIAGHPVATVCAGRTDAGVHALAQVLHFDTGADRPQSAWVRGVNALLPDAVAVQACRVVDQAFSARYSALRRAYGYLIYRGAHRHPMYSNRAAWCFRTLDVARMAQAGAALVGEHDFSAFRSSQCQAASPVRTLARLAIRESGPLVVLEVEANAFLHHMVRNIVGALVWVGLGRRPPEWVAELLAGGDRTAGAPTYAPQGLYLTGVEYPDQYPVGAWPPGSPPIAAV